MDDRQLLRYSRHILLQQVDIAGQEKLLNARVLIIGLGGLGSPVTMYLAASGVGHLVIVDHDKVELTNLQRQIVHTTASIGEGKTTSAAKQLKALNPDITITAINHKLDEAGLLEQARAADVVVDASDNFATRFAVNRACVKAKKPLVSGAVVRFEGQVAVFRPDLPDSPCYRCLYAESNDPEEACAEFGVLAPVAGIVGSIQATETLKLLLGTGQTLTGRVLLLDALTMEWRELKLRKDPTCPVCCGA
ncbi:MAG TPA: molybdopterin-synthase adenylyltransferase MoeB [Burkholderiales bacterium]|nr:molybdopterin-synthase adenylyltransferase MoeB [Burkholderiales bacterium]